MKGYYTCDIHTRAGVGFCPQCMSATLDRLPKHQDVLEQLVRDLIKENLKLTDRLNRSEG